ncbi:MAG: endonuclease/exonuclease/phosphatase family protein [Anaerolineae bacterium]
MPQNRLSAYLPDLLLVALVTTLGLQLMRVFFTMLVWGPGETFEIPQLGLIALGTFALVFLTPLLRKLVGDRWLVYGAFGGLAVLRLLEQILRTGQDDLVVAAAGTVLFTMALPVYTAWARARDVGPAGLAFGLPLGFALDSALRGLFFTYDLSWQRGLAPLAAVTLLGAGLVYLVWRLQPGSSLQDARLGASWLWLVLGPYFFLQLALLQSPALLAFLAGGRFPQGYALVGLANAGGIGFGFWHVRRVRPQGGWQWPLLSNGLTLLSLIWLAFGRPNALLGSVLPLLAQAGLTFNLITVARSQSPFPRKPGLLWTTIGFGLGWLFFAVIAFYYYSEFIIPILLPIAGAVMVAVVLLARRPDPLPPTGRRHWPGTAYAAALVALALLLGPIYRGLAWRTPQPLQGPAKTTPLHVQTFNIHQGVGSNQQLDLEAIAQVIEASGANVIGLQEVNRGWLASGGIDTLTWLSQRLGMPFVYSTLGDPLWGNAILSRFPMTDAGQARYPPLEGSLTRGYQWVTIQHPTQELLLINTHFTAEPEFGATRTLEAETLLRFWAEQPHTLITGDFNAEPDWPELEAIYNAGLGDAIQALSGNNPPTFPAQAPHQRLDYIWLSPDWLAEPSPLSQARVVPTLASDHLPVEAVISFPP